ncbi:hypothetical protein ACIA5H_10715 [Nocardia sp. NPDC051900]|uniref:hypothetical protein n=1 Tax=Nocardia sp. NPDC051900 TaxID=3364326 RepID=UPI003793CF3F
MMLATLLLTALLGCLIYRFAPERDTRTFRLERFHPATPMSDQPLSYYDHQRRYSDLAAIYGRGDVPDPDLPSGANQPGASRGHGSSKASSGKLAFSLRTCRSRGADLPHE